MFNEEEETCSMANRGGGTINPAWQWDDDSDVQWDDDSTVDKD